MSALVDPKRLPPSGRLATDAELSALWVGTPDEGQDHPEARAWLLLRAEALCDQRAETRGVR